jgi:hypothetical protein
MFEEVCEDITNTYDTNILDNQSEIVQKHFLDISLKNMNNKINPGKKVLMKLICNHYSPIVKKPIADFIGGPKTFSIHWHPVYKKIIYIFGEWHANNMDCKTFKKDAVTFPTKDYLYDLILSTDVFLDIYIELESYKGGEYLREPYTPGCTDELRQNEINADLARFGIPNTVVNDCRNYNKEDMVDLVNIWFPTGPVYNNVIYLLQ